MRHDAEPDPLSAERALLRRRAPESAGFTPWVTWPWVQQSATGVVVDEQTTLRAERDRRVLHVHPHACDRSYMHLPDVAVCAGVRGDPRVQMAPYTLERQGVAGGDSVFQWAPGRAEARALEQARWLRTSPPAAPEHVALSAEFNAS
eukprot:2477983-Rhodomonas_salina.1